MAKTLTAADREAALNRLQGWIYDDASASITRDFKFSGFSEAFGFMTRVALAAQQAGHHPDWSNSYDKVTIVLSTHDAGGLTDKDIDLATQIDKLLA